MSWSRKVPQKPESMHYGERYWFYFGGTQKNLKLLNLNSFDTLKGFSSGSVIKSNPANAGDTEDMSMIPGSGRFPREGNGMPLYYRCLGNPTDRWVWQAIVHGVTKSRTWVSSWACTAFVKQGSSGWPENQPLHVLHWWNWILPSYNSYLF